jgi:hypothetical protein
MIGSFEVRNLLLLYLEVWNNEACPLVAVTTSPFPVKIAGQKWQSSAAVWEVPIIEKEGSEGTAKNLELELGIFLTECVEQ